MAVHQARRPCPGSTAVARRQSLGKAQGPPWPLERSSLADQDPGRPSRRELGWISRALRYIPGAPWASETKQTRLFRLCARQRARQAAQVDTAWRVCWRRCAARPLAVVSPARRDLYARVHYRTSSRGFRVGRGIRVSRGGCLCGLWPDIRCRDRVLSIRSSQSVPWRLPSEAFLASHPACSTGAIACS